MMAMSCNISGVPRRMEMYSCASHASGLNLLIRARATTTPKGSEPTSVMRKISAVRAKPSMRIPIMTENSISTSSHRRS